MRSLDGTASASVWPFAKSRTIRRGVKMRRSCSPSVPPSPRARARATSTSRQSHSKRGVESFELHAGIVCGELPVGLCVMLVAMVLPGGDFFFEGRLVGNAAAQTLARQDAEFGFGHVEPASVFRGVVPFEPFGEAARFWGGKGRVERGGRVRAQIVLDEPDLFSVGKMHVRQFLEHLSVIGGGMAVGDLDAAPALEQRENHEYISHAVSLVIVPGRVVRPGDGQPACVRAAAEALSATNMSPYGHT